MTPEQAVDKAFKRYERDERDMAGARRAAQSRTLRRFLVSAFAHKDRHRLSRPRSASIQAIAGAASDDRLAAGARGWAQATFLLHSRFEAMSAPARNVASLAHTTSSVTHSQPTKVPKPQSTPA